MATSNELGDNQVATLHQYPVISQCDLCDTKEDVHSFCRNCSQNLCVWCKRTHLRSTVSRDHNIVHISEGKSSESEATACTKHGERLFFYCRTCSVLFCPKCLDPTHKNHDFLDTDKYVEELQSKVAMTIEEKSKNVEESKRNIEHIEQHKKKYAEACTKSKTSVMDGAKFLHSEVDRVKGELLSKINHCELQGLSKFDIVKDEEKSILEEQQASLDKVVRHSKKHDNISLVAYASELYINDDLVKKDNNQDEQYSKQDLIFDSFAKESKSDIPSFSVPTVDLKATTLLSKNAISELFGTLRMSYADVPRKYVEGSTTKLPESQMEVKVPPPPKRVVRIKKGGRI
ncbi:hypothetical protein FSP39_020018 [Pinctada imbricata]|uniref:B box-type domain-containing protein n=1 Tax=Pinctada imbricata TaxID=66713 RepID=A0AA89BL43_PINIB|nr:hypothetical protein FSP39_020018 [Pinctada imbricata]